MRIGKIFVSISILAIVVAIILLSKSVYDSYKIETNNYDDLKLRMNGNITLIVSDKTKINSKKEDINLNNEINVKNNTDIELENGFIFVKNSCIIKSNKNFEVRKSIISK